MPLIVAGMPAAGTALVVACLRACGVRFPDGCSGESDRDSRIAAEPWGLVDATGSLALPVWLAGHPTAPVVVCLRNPLEVAVSLRRRHAVPLETGLTIWTRHVDMLLGTTTATQRVVVHYDAFRQGAEQATRRLAGALALPEPVDHAAPGRALREAASPRFTVDDLVACGIDESALHRYRRLCGEAGHVDQAEPDRSPDRAVLRDLADACRRLGAAADTGASGLERVVATLQADVARLRGELAARDDDLHDLLDDLRHDVEEDHLSAEKRIYRRAIRGIRDLVRTHVPAGGIVAVVSKGDEQLLRQRHHVAWHFPRDPAGGGYLGYHPASDLAAIANLETTRAAGATHLLVPETYAWWLTSYAGFARHLERHARLVEARPGAGAIYDLTPPDRASLTPATRIADALGRRPQVLAWDAPAAGAVFHGCHVFEPLAPTPRLPHIDASIDVVAVSRPSPERLAEACRVASVAVVDVGAEPAIHWIDEPVPPALPSVSIVMPVHGKWPITASCLRALLPSLPTGWPVELVIVDDASADETPDRLAALAASERRMMVLRNDVNLGFVGSSNRGAAAATGDYLVFLNNDTVPLPGWLPPLIRTFHDFPDAGAVGGKLLFPDGRLQEAGGVIFADGSACNFGREHPDPSARIFNHVRHVDYVSGALLATPRRLFLALGGFGADFAPGYYEDTDYCFRLRECGRDVLLQPESVIVHLEGGTAGTDDAAGMKRFQEINRRRFRARHAAALAGQGERPAAFSRDTWTALAHRGRGKDR